MRRRRSALLLATALAAVLGGATIAAAGPSSSLATGAAPVGRFVPDVLAQFDALSPRPDGLAFDIGTSPDPNTCQHYQGIARGEGADGTPFLFVSRAGVLPTGCVGVRDEGNLLVVRMGSRDRNGERLRSNRLFRDLGAFADPRDVVTRTVTFDGGASWPAYRSSTGWPAYGHPGGMQLVGDVLALALEDPYAGAPGAAIAFLDVSFPEAPRFLSALDLEDDPDDDDFGAGAVGLAPVAVGGACCRYLLVVTGKDNVVLRFYLSDPTAGGVTDLKREGLGWTLLRSYRRAELEAEGCLGTEWPSGSGFGHQTLNFVRQGDVDGTLYLVGARNDFLVGTGDDLLDLYRVELVPGVAPPACPLRRVRTSRATPTPYGALRVSANFAAGSGVYVSPSGELVVYATDYENQGPRRRSADGTIDTDSAHQTAAFAEYRHRDIVRPDSPTLRPTAAVDGPFVGDEGSSVLLTGRGEQAITRAWIQVFDEEGAGTSSPEAADAWLAIEFVDRDREDWDDLWQLGADGETLAERASSWRWFAPPGCTISANNYPTRSALFPGEGTVLLAGSGSVGVEPDLGGLGFEDTLEGVTFFHVDEEGRRVHDCEGYYSKPIGLGWDLDGNGSFETGGTSVTFDASAIDGPTTATVFARGTHPTDTTPLGIGASLAVPVTVRNVAPRLETVSVTDALGNTVASGGGATAIAGLSLLLDVTFTDPGRADTQTAVVDWGDGALDTTFTTFSDARGGVLGRLNDARAFATPGTYDIVATVRDDDGGGTASDAVRVQVVSPAQAIEDLADELTARIASAPNPTAAAALRDARDQLIGNRGGRPPTNGALDKLEDGDPVSAITKLRAAIVALAAAESSGAGSLSRLQGRVGLVAEAIATAEYEKAAAAVSPPSAGERRALAQIVALLESGRARLLAGTFAVACDDFRQAAAKAVDLRT